MTISRRQFVAALSAAAASALAPAGYSRSLLGQGEESGAGGVRRTMSGPMNENAYRSVRRPAKPGATVFLSNVERDALEHQLHCQCGCTLDVYTCRTTDFTCPVSPGMHRDVIQLIAGGYLAPEILAAFRETYGDRVLMAPAREGFNWAAYLTPFVVLAGGAGVLAVLIHRWTSSYRKPADPPAPGRARSPGGVNATPEELARLAAAVRDDAE